MQESGPDGEIVCLNDFAILTQPLNEAHPNPELILRTLGT